MRKSKDGTSLRSTRDDSVKTMGNEAILLPPLNDGVITLGDLWDCRSATAVGNLFEKPLRKEHLDPHPILLLDYNMQRVKTARDFNSEMHIAVELELECAGGAVKIKGKAAFDREERQKFDQEMLLCNYDLMTYEVRVLPNATTITGNSEKDVMSKRVRDLLKDGSIQATHYVQSIILGGQAQAAIKYYENIDRSHMNLFGSLEGTIELGPVTATAKASLQLLDTTYKENFSTEITIKAQPRLNSAPTSTEAMFKEVENIDSVIEKEIFFPVLNEEPTADNPVPRVIFGIPLKFRLLPLNRIADINGGKDDTYLVLKQEILDNYSNMMLSLEDYSYEEYLKMNLRDDVPAIIPILQDDFHPITQELAVLSNKVMVDAKRLKQEAVELYNDYKYGLVVETDLQDLIKKYSKEIPLPDITAKVQELGQRARMELASIRVGDIVNLSDEENRPAVLFFTNKIDMDDWYFQERTIKLLLRTGDQADKGSPNGVFLKLFAMGTQLQEIGVEVGIAFPSVAQEFTLTLKTSRQEIKYAIDDIDFALELFRMATASGDGDIFANFFSLFSELLSIEVPLKGNNLEDFPIFLNIMHTYLPRDGNVFICETYCELLAKLSCTLDSWNFVFPLDALDRAVTMIKTFRRLRGIIPSSLKHNFFFSKFNISSKTSSPLMFVFNDNTLKSVCYDSLDITILLQNLISNTGSYWDAISVAQARQSCLYIDQWNYATEVIPKCVLDHSTSLSELLSPHEPFPENSDVNLKDALIIMRALVVRKDKEVITEVAKMALRNFQMDLEPLLIKFVLWLNGEIQTKNMKAIDWGGFSDAVTTLFLTSAPHLVKVQAFRDQLKKLMPPEPEKPEIPEDPENPPEEPDPIPGIMHKKITNLISFLTKLRGDEVELLMPLNIAVSKYKLEKGDWITRQTKIVMAFDVFLQNSAGGEQFFHLYQLSQLIETMALQGTLTDNPLPIASAYCNRVKINDLLYPGVQITIEKCLSQKQLFKALTALESIVVHPLIHMTQKAFYQIKSLPDPVSAKSIVEKLNLNDFNEDQLEIVFSNPKFLHLIRNSLDNSGLIDTLYVLLSKYTKIPKNSDDFDVFRLPHYVPVDIAEKVKPLFSRQISNGPLFQWDLEWHKDVINFIHQLNIFVVRNNVPDNFQNTFQKNLGTDVSPFEQLLQTKNSLFYWNVNKRIFTNYWTLLAVKEVLQNLKSFYDPVQIVQRGKKLKNGTNNMIMGTTTLTHSSRPFHLLNMKQEVEVVDKWLPFVNSGTLKSIPHTKFTEIRKIRLLPPKTSYGMLNLASSNIIPHVLENLRSNNQSVLDPKYLSKLVDYPIPGNFPGQINFGQGIPEPSIGLVLTRSDILTALLQLTDPEDVHNLLQILTHSPYALPLIINDISRPAVTNDVKFISLLHAFKRVLTAGIKTKQYFFTSPYRFILCLRVGNTSPLLGRSSLVNRYLMKEKNVFSSMTEPGSNFGESVSRSGTIEFIPLSTETCEGLLWEALNSIPGLAEDHILMGLLHGNAFTFNQEFFNFIKPFVSCLVIFWKVSDWKSLQQQKIKLSQLVGTDKKSLDVILYPDASIVNKVRDENLLHPIPFVSANPGQVDVINSAKLRRIICEAADATVKDFSLVKIPKTSVTQITQLPQMSSIQSNGFIELIKTNSISIVKNALWSLSDELGIKILTMFMEILLKVEDSRQLALHHIMFELDHMSEASSLEIRTKITELRSQITNSSADAELSTHQLYQEIKLQLEKLQSNVLSLSNLFHATGIYLTSTGTPEAILQFSKTIADCILLGFPIELEDCFSPEFAPILHEAISLLPSTIRVFVLSITGLKNSGKSALLNRLFGGRGFSEWSSTKGVLLKLVWVAEDIREELECDAFLLLDCEGVAVPENKTNDAGHFLETRLLTMLLSTSDLTLINIKQDIGQFASVFESALLSIVTQEEDDARIQNPDIHLVLQGTLNDSEIQDAFVKSIQNVNFLSQRNMQLGTRSKGATRLVQLNATSQKGGFVYKFKESDAVKNQPQNFKEITNLRFLIETKCKQSRGNIPGRRNLQEWFKGCEEAFHMLEIAKSKVTPTQFSHLIVNAAQTISEMEVFTRLMQVKFAISKSFQVHEERLLPYFIESLAVIFKNEPTVDESIELALNRVGQDLLSVINTCTFKIETSVRKFNRLKSSAVNPDSCRECSEAYFLREELFKELEGTSKSFLIIEDIETLTNQIRFQTFNRFKQLTLSEKVKNKLSSGLMEVVQDLVLNSTDYAEVFLKFVQYLSTLQTIPNSKELFYSEFQLVYRRLLNEVVNEHNPFNNNEFNINLEEVELFDSSKFYSESTVVTPTLTKLTWNESLWLDTQLRDIPTALCDEYGGIVYKFGMVMRLYEKVLDIVDLLGEKIGVKANEFSLRFYWSVHSLAANYMITTLKKEQADWCLENDATVLMDKDRATFIRNPNEYFKPGVDEEIPLDLQLASISIT